MKQPRKNGATQMFLFYFIFYKKAYTCVNFIFFYLIC